MSGNELELSNSEAEDYNTLPGLDRRQTDFVWNIVEGKSAKDAYVAAGYKAKGRAAEAAASHLLGDGNVQAMLTHVREELDEALNERQRRFVIEYLKDFNGAAAYKRAGYQATGNRAEAAASRLLRDVKVQRALAHAREELMRRIAVDKDYVMRELKRNYERAMQLIPVYDREGNPTGEYQYNGQVANRSLELMGKELGMFGDKLEVSGGLEPIKTLTIVKHVRDDGSRVNAH